MSEWTMFFLSAGALIVVCIGGLLYYAKRKGALRAAANVVTQAAKQDVADVADKLTK